MLDDDRDLLSAIRDLLSKHSHVVDCCDNAPEAVALAEQGSYDFVFIDYKMPDHDGIWFMNQVKLPRKTKALLMTAYINRDVINRMFAAGACGYIVKPFDEEEILRHLAFFAQAPISKTAKPPR